MRAADIVLKFYVDVCFLIPQKTKFFDDLSFIAPSTKRSGLFLFVNIFTFSLQEPYCVDIFTKTNTPSKSWKTK